MGPLKRNLQGTLRSKVLLGKGRGEGRTKWVEFDNPAQDRTMSLVRVLLFHGETGLFCLPDLARSGPLLIP